MSLAEKHERFIRSLHLRGPMLASEALERLPRATFYDLVRRKYLVAVPTVLGKAVVVGPRGRVEILAMTRFYRPRATAVADAVLLRRAIRIAEREGWRFQGRNPRGRIAFLSRGGEKMMLVASLRAYSTHSLKNTLRRMNWYSRKKLGEAEGVRVYHPYPRRFDRMVKEGGLEVRPLSEILPPDVDAEE
ncbi:hypothetical protein [Meiothermus ruber]|uniref:hypothetical protein n=1 Tax=Meiothermus ruber TaxID=277 RepID=UPI00034B162A|nr:hypothetical protein [Meiothermus ruber]GAO74208.1 putative uncharacterized protein [Meiothermus ruber H328]